MQSSIKSLRCPSGYQVSTICSSIKCLHPASCCEQQQCECAINHQTCNLLRYKNLYKKLACRIVPHQELLSYINTLYDDIIDEISKLRQTTQEIVKYYGLKQNQIKILKAIQNNQVSRLIGKDVLLACESVQSEKFQFQAEKTKQLVIKIWQQTCHFTLTPFFQIKDICQLPSLYKGKSEKLIARKQQLKQKNQYDIKKSKKKNPRSNRHRQEKLKQQDVKAFDWLENMLEVQIAQDAQNIQNQQGDQKREEEKVLNQVKLQNQKVKKDPELVKQQAKPIKIEKKQDVDNGDKKLSQKVQQLKSIFGQGQKQMEHFIQFWQQKFGRQLQMQQLCEIYLIKDQK